MSPLENLFRIISKNANTGEICYELQPDPQNPIYLAHFPEQPITPGVCIIDWLTRLVVLEVGRPLELLAVRNAKFIAPLIPHEHTPVTFAIQLTQCTTIDVKAVVRQQAQILTKLSVRYA